jgi:hypothetical protein
MNMRVRGKATARSDQVGGPTFDRLGCRDVAAAAGERVLHVACQTVFRMAG